MYNVVKNIQHIYTECGHGYTGEVSVTVINCIDHGQKTFYNINMNLDLVCTMFLDSRVENNSWTPFIVVDHSHQICWGWLILSVPSQVVQ